MTWAKRHVALALALGAALGAGCGSGGGSPAAATAPPAGPPPSLAALDGTWRGSSAQGGLMSFTVSGARITSLSIQWSGQGSGGACSMTSQHVMNAEISPGGNILGFFSHVQSDLDSFRGQFNTATEAGGTFVESLGGCSSGVVSWSAGK